MQKFPLTKKCRAFLGSQKSKIFRTISFLLDVSVDDAHILMAKLRFKLYF